MARRPAKRAMKRGATRRGGAAKPARKKSAPKRSVKRQKKAAAASHRKSTAKRTRKTAARQPKSAAPTRTAATAGRSPRLDRARRTLEDPNLPTPPSSLNLDRHGSAVRTGRAEMLDNQRKHGKMNAVTAGDVDVDAEDAYFTGEEAPGGDNPTPDQDVVDDIGKALGVEYQDDEELQASDKVAERDKHRWELDPASSEDYKNRK